jgi:TPR repeat protein
MEQALYWLMQAAEEGNDPLAQFVLGDIYRFGEGVEQNHNEAFRWYILAAEQTLVEAEYMTGILIADGLGAPENDFMALRWLRKAAKQGHARAFYALGEMYQRGEGIDEDLVQAYVWYSAAAELQHSQAAARRNLLTANLEPELLVMAQDQAASCIASEFQLCE